ncbi:MAG: M20/M25/M40 family metallo-hydrolase, partial [Chitinophagaceae bacterium]
MPHDRIDILQADAVSLLKELIGTPSFSKEEGITAGILCRFLGERGIVHYRNLHNVYAFNEHYDKAKPSVLLNSHHDTVKPNKGYTLDPFTPVVKDGKLFGLGSNDAGGCLVALIATFLYFYHRSDLPFNVVLAASAEEEISGFNGIELLLKDLGPIDFGIVGEPTQMQMAIAEKGLLVLDVHAEGRAGHAAREEGENAIYKTLKDIQWFSTYKYPKVSDLLGPVKMSVTVIETENKAHNVVPSQCHFVVDVRVNELYTFEEVLGIIKSNTSCKVTPRSLR